MPIELLNGAFIAEFQKGENGKPGVWKTTPILEKIGKKKEHKHNGKEVPQFEIINDIEANSKQQLQESLKTTIIEVTQYLKQLSNGSL